jgi:hypothetical protein
MNQFQPVVGQRTDRGRVRPRNEDAVGVPPPDLDPRLVEQKGRAAPRRWPGWALP